jgi:hypothetical protein
VLFFVLLVDVALPFYPLSNLHRALPLQEVGQRPVSLAWWNAP